VTKGHLAHNNPLQFSFAEWTWSNIKRQGSLIRTKLECGPMPNVMVALPNIGGALCSTPQSLADARYLTTVQ